MHVSVRCRFEGLILSVSVPLFPVPGMLRRHRASIDTIEAAREILPGRTRGGDVTFFLSEVSCVKEMFRWAVVGVFLTHSSPGSPSGGACFNFARANACKHTRGTRSTAAWVFRGECSCVCDAVCIDFRLFLYL